MKKMLFSAIALSLLVASGCATNQANALDQRVSNLENKVQALEGVVGNLAIRLDKVETDMEAGHDLAAEARGCVRRQRERIDEIEARLKKYFELQQSK